MNEICPVNDLRSALEYLKTIPGQYLETDVEVDPIHELSGVYRRVGAGGTVQRPTREGPAMMFTNIKGHPGAKIAIGLMASRKRVAHLLGTEPQNLGRFMMESVTNPVAPVVIDGPAPCQEEVHLASDPDFDVRKLVPASTNTPDDGGPYITLGLLRSKDPETGETDVTNSPPVHSRRRYHLGISAARLPAPGHDLRQVCRPWEAYAPVHQHWPGSRHLHRGLLRAPHDSLRL